MEFSRQEYWNGLLFPSPGNPPDPGIETMSLMSLALARGLLYHYCQLGSPSMANSFIKSARRGSECFLATQISYMALHNQGTTSRHLCHVLLVRIKGRDYTRIHVTRIMGKSVKNHWFFYVTKMFSWSSKIFVTHWIKMTHKTLQNFLKVDKHYSICSYNLFLSNQQNIYFNCILS